MISALQQVVVPVLRERGFSGSFPHFRRIARDRVDLITFQFDRWGGGFVIEISSCADSGIETAAGERIPAGQARAIDNHPDRRHRLKPGSGGSREDWFRYDQRTLLGSSGKYKRVAESVLPFLEEAQAWWLAHRRRGSTGNRD